MSRTLTITATHNTHQTACTHTTQNPTNKPHPTDSKTETNASYDTSEKPINNRRLRQPTTAPTRGKTHNISTTTPYKYYINSTHEYKKYTTSLHIHTAAQHIKTKHKPTNHMENNREQPSSAPRGRRNNQRYRRGAHNVTLDSSARLALTQHFAAKSRAQPPAVSDPISLTISSYYSAPLGGRRVLEAVLPPHHDRADLTADPIYFNHPSAREDLQHPLLLRTSALGLNSVVIENYYVTGVHSNTSQDHASFFVYIYLPNDYDHTTDLINVLTLQLDSMSQAGYPTSPLGMRDAQVTTILGDIPTSEPDDDPIDTMTLITPPQLSPYPSKFCLALPTNSPASVGLLLLASRQAPWTTIVPDALIPPNIPEDLRTRLSQQTPTITRTTNTPPKAARDMCTIYSPAFNGLKPTECLRHLRASILHTLNKLLTATEYRQPHDTATMAAHLSPPYPSTAPNHRHHPTSYILEGRTAAQLSHILPI